MRKHAQTYTHFCKKKQANIYTHIHTYIQKIYENT